MQFIPFADHLVYFFARIKIDPLFSPGLGAGHRPSEKSTGVDRPIRASTGSMEIASQEIKSLVIFSSYSRACSLREEVVRWSREIIVYNFSNIFLCVFSFSYFFIRIFIYVRLRFDWNSLERWISFGELETHFQVAAILRLDRLDDFTSDPKPSN